MSFEWLAIVPILSLLMLVHEWGHFITARRSGIVVQEFGFGLPPRLFGINRGGVIYSINAIPFGAFVKMLGEEDPTQPGSFARQPKRVRALVLAAGSGMNFITAGVVFAIAYLSGWPTPVENEVEIAQVVVGGPAEQAGLRAGDLVQSVNGQAIRRVEDFRNVTQQSVGQSMRVDVLRDGSKIGRAHV